MGNAFLCIEDLQENPIFEGLSDHQLGWLVQHAQCVELERGESLWIPDTPADAMFVVLAGALQMYFDIGGQTLKVDASMRNGVIGLLPYSRMTEFKGKTFAAESTQVLRIGKEHFPAMLQNIPELGYRLVALLSDRVRAGTRAADQREKMMALGKLSAGLAHELNNPAAAVQRATDDLQQRLRHSNDLVVRMAEHQLTPEQMRAIVKLRERGSPKDAAGLSALERGDREDDLGDWLDEQGIDDAWMLAEAFVAAGLELDSVRQACVDLPEAAAPDVLAWIGSGLAARQLLSQVATASSRISKLVGSIKSYSHMDQTPDMEPTDLHEGLDSTVTMMTHKLKNKNIDLVRRYDEELPRVPAQVSNLNQVWTNLIDNAIDASEPGGKLQLSTEHDACSAFIRVTDNGGGIAPENQARIFDTFFTTKPVGEGTGLGLDIALHIVQQHDGEITLDSQPGRTEFTVRLPLESV